MPVPHHVPALAWVLTVAAIAALLTFDFFVHVRRAHIPSVRESAAWTAFYVGVAASFGIGLSLAAGPVVGTEFFAGYLTELSLSVDNLFVFLVIMSAFKVPRADQQKVLMFGIVVSLCARTAFIVVGIALIEAFTWMFYLFGIFLLVTAGRLLLPEDEEPGSDEANNLVIRLARRFLRTTDTYDGDKLTTMVDGRRVLTPMLLVMVAIGGTDVMFALDSIPAIFGLTQNTYVVFSAVAFSLLGLRQLYFLLDGLLDRLVHLKYGLAVILGFIGVKLVLHALATNNVPFVNGGRPVEVVEITTQLSLLVIAGALGITVVTSLLHARVQAK